MKTKVVQHSPNVVPDDVSNVVPKGGPQPPFRGGGTTFGRSGSGSEKNAKVVRDHVRLLEAMRAKGYTLTLDGAGLRVVGPPPREDEGKAIAWLRKNAAALRHALLLEVPAVAAVQSVFRGARLVDEQVPVAVEWLP